MFERQELALLRSVFADRHRALALGKMPVSVQCDERIACLPRVRHYPLRRVACLLMAAMLAVSAIVMVLGADSGLVIENYSEGVAVSLAVEPGAEFVEARPKWIPPDYRLITDRSNQEETYLIYEGEKGDFFCYAQYAASNHALFPIGDHAYAETTVADEYEAVLVQKEGNTCLFFTDGTHLYLINGTLSHEDCFAVAESVLKGE